MRSSERTTVRLLVVSLLALLLISPVAAQGGRLHVLAATGTAAEVRAALQAGADFNDADWSGVTALMAAAGNNHDPNVVKVLLDFGALVDARDGNGETALMSAAQRNKDPAVIITLLGAGAALESRDYLGRTPLIHAAKSSPVLAIVTTLLKAGAKVNARDNQGLTPLLYAAWLGENPAIVSALLEAGADPKACGTADRSLVEYAESNPAMVKDSAVMKQLRDATDGTRSSAQRSQSNG